MYIRMNRSELVFVASIKLPVCTYVFTSAFSHFLDEHGIVYICMRDLMFALCVHVCVYICVTL